MFKYEPVSGKTNLLISNNDFITVPGPQRVLKTVSNEILELARTLLLSYLPLLG